MWATHEFLLKRVSFDEQHIHYRSFFFGRKRIPWSTVARLEYAPTLNMHRLETLGFGRFYLTADQRGMTEFQALYRHEFEEIKRAASPFPAEDDGD